MLSKTRKTLLLSLLSLLLSHSLWTGAAWARGRGAKQVRPTSVAVVGAGNYGTALAQRLALNGHKVKLWAREGDVVAGIRRRGYNPRFLQGVPLDSRIKPHGSLKKTLKGKKFVVVAVPSEHLASMARKMAPFLDRDAIVVSATKGLSSKGGFATMTEVLARALDGRIDRRRLAAFSGPGFATEIGQQKRTLVTVAAKNPGVGRRVKQLFDTGGSFSVETSRDVKGVQFWGAAKNPLAILSGTLEGLGVDRRTRQAVLGQAISELARLATRHGASPGSFFTAAALGDIVLTSSAGSRNYRLGHSLGQGRTPQQILAGMNGQVAEGISNAASFQQLGRRYRIATPAFDALNAVVAGKKPPRALLELGRGTPARTGKGGVWRRGVAVIEASAGVGAGLGLSFNPRAELMMRVTRDVARLARATRGGSLLSTPELAASIVLTNGSASGPAYQRGQHLGAGKLGKAQLTGLRRQVGSLLRDAHRARVSTPALQTLHSALKQPDRLGKLLRPDPAAGTGGPGPAP